MKHIYRSLIMMLLAGILLAACAPAALPEAAQTPTAARGNAQDATPTAGSHQETQPEAVKTALAALAKQIGTAANQIKVKSFEQVDWNDACLGVQNPDQMCAQVITPGYKVVLEVADGKTYEFHTNKDGSTVVLASGSNSAGGKQPEGSLPGAVLKAKQVLAQQLGVSADAVKVASFEKVEWPNGCLGVQMPGRMCTQVITTGYRVNFELDGKQYEFHTDENGGAIIQAVAPLPQTADKILVWEQTENGACSRAEIGAKGVAHGACGSTLQETPLQPQRGEELAYLLATYTTFNSVTKAGTVQFNGMGQAQPTEAEMRSVAEWAKLVFMEAEGGRGGAAWGLALAWHREGGIAGMCNDLGIYLNGWALPSSCKAGNAQSYNPYRLSADELAQLYAWVDQYKNIDYEHKDAATADSMKVIMTFSGAGSEQAPADIQEQIVGFASKIYANAVQ